MAKYFIIYDQLFLFRIGEMVNFQFEGN